MKIHTLIPAILALVILAGGPFGFGKRCETDPRAELICYCCSDMGKNCTMISCAGCCGAHAGSAADRQLPEMLPESFPTLAPANIAYGDGESLRLPETVYLEVPDKPPKRA
ncbi:MAG: hypothetical protein ACYC7J_05655 [Syntrophales bacterium]